ncbi:putative tape measure protein [Kononvirus KKP3711]|uniref:Tape measure protein n=1 Tax=Enterobacter phage KKP_3711 TaxID=3109398 RepID=A0AAX4Q517_9CAUD
MDKLIRELLINVKQQGATKTTKAIQGIVDALEDAAVGAELANEQLAKISPTLAGIEKNARKTAASMADLGATKNLDRISKSLSTIEDYLDELLTTSTVASEKMAAGFGTVANAVNKMGNNIAGTVERTEDQLIGLNTTVGRTGKSFTDTATSATKVTRAVGDTSGAARGATRDFASLAKIGGGLPIMYAAIASNVFVLQSAFEQFKIGDQLNRLERFGSLVGSMTGTPVQSLAVALQGAVNGAISFQEAMQQASVASTYGFNTKQIEQFGLVARRASAVLGVDMVDALNRVIKGVSKQEIELLDELGVTIRLNDAYAKYVQVLNSANTGITYNINTLNTYQKQQAYANAVIDDSTKKLGQLDSALRATAWEQFAANANAALRSVQQAAASFLDPVIERINIIMNRAPVLNRIAESQAAIQSIQTMDSKNVGAVLNAYNNAFQRSAESAKETMATMQQVRDNEKQIDEIYSKRRKMEGQTAKELGLSWSAYKEQITSLVRQEDQLSAENERLNKNLEESSKNALAFTREQDVATKKLQQNKTLWDSITDASGNVNPDKLTAALDAANATTTSIKNDIPAINGMLGDQSSTLKNSQKIAADLAGVMNTVKNNAAATGRSEDEVLATYGLQYKTMKELEAAQKGFNQVFEATKSNSKDALEVQQKIADVYAQTRDKEKAQAAGRELEVQQLDKQLSKLKQAQAAGVASKEIQDEINKLETQKLNIQNQSMEAAKKTKDISDKIVGIEEQIKLLKDTTLNSDQYAMANLQLQLQIEKQRQAILAGNAQKQRDYMQSKLNEAQIERQINELTFSQAEAASKRQREQEIAMRNATGEYTSQENLLNQINNLERERVELIKNAKDANVALDTNRITDLQNQVLVLKQQLKTEQADKNRNFQNQTTGLLGGTYSSSMGQSAGMKEMTEFMNNQQGYAQAISNLQAINSEATAAGQSLGNMVNAMMQFSNGSLDATSMVAAGMQTISSAIQYSTSQQISSIDAAIAAEQARDGQSEESKAKIKKLEAEKIKVQQESAKKQILIQTAVAVMQAATSVPYPWSIPLMIAAAAAGALSYAQASSATPQLDGMSGGSGTTASLTLGKRDNSVDVSRNSSGGELSYIRGESGVGNANNFVPRAEGGNMIPGVGYITGENGIEVITPSVPSKAVPADQVGSAGKGGSAVILQVQAMDARSFVDFANENSAALRGAVEIALNENGMSLDNLSRR